MLISKLEEILKPHLQDDERDDLDLSDHNCIYRKFYFNNLPESSAKEAISLFPNSDRLWEKYKIITTPASELSESDICGVVYDYLKSVALIMGRANRPENEEALRFINQLDRNSVTSSEKMEDFSSERNMLHSFAYGTLSNFVIDELPEDKAYWVLYEWAIEQGHVATDACYFLQDYFESDWVKDTNIFDSALKLHQSGNFNRYWIEGNSFTGENKKVFCNAKA